MLRKLNFTDRAKVSRANVRVTLRRDDDGVLVFDPTLSLEDLAAPADARVFIEAYHRTSYMRFDCGTVGAIAVPADRRLTDIESSSVRFRIKIVDDRAHRIVAVADDIRVTEHAPGPGQESPLLPVQFTDEIDQQAWRILFEPDTPVLQLNNRISGIEKLAKEDSLFFALVYPAAVREILTRILLVEGHDVFEQTGEWWSLWIRWASRYTNTPMPSDPDDAPQWIEDVVGAFCSQHRVVDRINAVSGEPQ
jgi:hypothetical protein